MTDNLDWKSLNWRQVYRRTHEPPSLPKLTKSYWFWRLSIRAIALVVILIASFTLPSLHIKPNPSNIVIFSLAIAWLGWLGWITWPMIENRFTKRLVIRSRIRRKLNRRIWQKDFAPLEIIVQKACWISPDGELTKAGNWIGLQHINIPVWLCHYVDEREEVDFVCIATKKVLGKLEHYANPQ